jgi:hypothetical protein
MPERQPDPADPGASAPRRWRASDGVPVLLLNTTFGCSRW